jgi:hypothetical protein
MKPTLRTPNQTLGTRITVHITIIHLETLHQNLPKRGPISSELGCRRFEDFQADTDAAFNKAQNRIGRNRTGQIISVAPVRIPKEGTMKQIRRRPGQTRGATVEESEVLIVSSVRESRGIQSGIGVFLWARGVPEVGAGEGHGSGGLVEPEESVTQRHDSQLG